MIVENMRIFHMPCQIQYTYVMDTKYHTHFILLFIKDIYLIAVKMWRVVCVDTHSLTFSFSLFHCFSFIALFPMFISLVLLMNRAVCAMHIFFFLKKTMNIFQFKILFLFAKKGKIYILTKKKQK